MVVVVSSSSYFAQNRPGSDLDCLMRVWPNTPGLEASRCAGIIGPGFWQDSTGPLPVSHFQTRFRSSTSDLVLADYVRCWPNGSGPEASRCARIIRPASGQCFRVDPDRMRMGSGTLTGDTCTHSTEGFCSHMSTKDMEMEIGV